MDKRWTIASLLLWSKEFLSEHGIETPRLDAEILLAHALGVSRVSLYVLHDRPLDASELARYKASIIARARDRKPVAYITGRRGFWQHDFEVSEGVLIPRPETEHIVERALSIARSYGGGHFVDICTGSGAILVSVAADLADSGWTFEGSDISAAALSVARVNGERILGPLGVGVRWVERDLLAGVGEDSVDILTANPPYVVRSVMASLAPELCHEPAIALDGGLDGLDLIRRIAVTGLSCLVLGGHILVEIGSDQGEAARALFEKAGYIDVGVGCDYAGKDRFIEARKAPA